MVKNILIIGAGYAGCCLANMLSADHKVTLIEKTDSPGGMCKTYYLDGLPYEYGPHILAYHNCSEEAIAYVRRHLDFTETRLSSASVIDGKIAAYPPSLQSAKDLGVLDTVKEELQSLPEVPNESNFETYLIDKVGPTLYELYFKHFTKKFWGVEPSFLSASWAKTRHLGESVTDDEMFFNKIWCGYPSSDWNDLFKNLLDDRIQVYLSCPITSINLSDSFIITSSGEKFYFDLLISTTPIDFVFDYVYGELEYAGYDIEPKILDKSYYLEYKNKSISMTYYPGNDSPYTRVTDYNSFNGKSNFHEYRNTTIVTFEKPTNQIKLYPFYDDRNNLIFNKYLQLSAKFNNYIPFGRLGLYKYLTIDTTTDMAFRLLSNIPTWTSLSIDQRFEVLQFIRGDWHN